MTKIDLPDGVPFDNEGKADLSDRAHSVPDMATPQFKQPTFRQDNQTNQAPQRDFSTLVEDNDHSVQSDIRGRGQGGPRNQVMIVAAIAVLLVLLGAFAISTKKAGTPLCSSQPIWNQYNCQVG